MATKNRLTPLIGQPHPDAAAASQGKRKRSSKHKSAPKPPQSLPDDESRRSPSAPVQPRLTSKQNNRSGEEDALLKTSAPPHNRVWTDKDQITILQGIIDFKAQKGADPNADYAAFHVFIIDQLEGSFSKNQTRDKVRGLKRKFLTLNEKGDLPTSAQPYEYQVYQLLAKIWGTASSTDADFATGEEVKSKTVESTNTVDAPKAASDEKTTAHDLKERKKKKKRKKPKTRPEEEVEKTAGDDQISAVEKDVQTAANLTAAKGKDSGDFHSKYPCLVRSFNKENYSFSTEETLDMLKEKVSLIQSSQAGEIEEKWLKLREEHAAHCVKVADLVALQARLMVDALCEEVIS
ncbi:unnamed protein product [Cuscuta epithymum]|uniref:Glabrous enhancer-binding protein-like DBD domain-containing protein n=1 Tax=Cuscuta epithymum TaxID=186058 RepID=A0AAV0CZ75_9ASTE|nr:unnamed protein product [Cuscuta epithymum]CAH9088323.1 unnamed protein product [Cuscuta epithymum]